MRRHRLAFVDDASNDDERYARNRLRRQVWPALVAAFPAAEAHLVASARRAAEAAAALDELALHDGAVVCGPDGAISVARWLALSPARRGLLLRHWLAQRAGGAPDTLVQRLLAELPRARGGSRWPAPAGPLQLVRGELRTAAVASHSSG